MADSTKPTASLVFTNHVAQTLDEAVAAINPSSVHVLVDVNTRAFVLPLLQAESKAVASAKVLEIKAGEIYKNIDSLSSVWRQLGDGDANRRSLLINIGGGVITDMGAFAAATFKRGIPFINIPTTLLCAVDASLGGKNGINFNGLKNEIGTFTDADLIIVNTLYFNTLTSQELLSGYAEMLKHALLTSTEMTARLLRYDVTAYEPDTLLNLLKESVEVKCSFVAEDPKECGRRKALNLGHTFGHAFEELALERHAPLSHGYAVAFGMVAALVLSHMKEDFPSDRLHQYADYVRHHYGAYDITCNDYDRLLEFMAHDKKNTTPGRRAFTLLKDIGQPVTDVEATPDEVKAALDIYRDLLL